MWKEDFLVIWLQRCISPNAELSQLSLLNELTFDGGVSFTVAHWAFLLLASKLKGTFPGIVATLCPQFRPLSLRHSGLSAKKDLLNY